MSYRAKTIYQWPRALPAGAPTQGVLKASVGTLPALASAIDIYTTFVGDDEFCRAGQQIAECNSNDDEQDPSVSDSGFGEPMPHVAFV